MLFSAVTDDMNHMIVVVFHRHDSGRIQNVVFAVAVVVIAGNVVGSLFTTTRASIQPNYE